MSEVNRRRLATILGPLLGSIGTQAEQVARDLDTAGVRAPTAWTPEARQWIREWRKQVRRDTGASESAASTLATAIRRRIQNAPELRSVHVYLNGDAVSPPPTGERRDD